MKRLKTITKIIFAYFMLKDVKVIMEIYKIREMIHLGEGLHFIQEDYPHEIGQRISDWYKKLIDLRVNVREKKHWTTLFQGVSSIFFKQGVHFCAF